MAIKIEKGIPIPTSVGSRIYPFGEMAVGDSFVWTGNQQRLISAMSYYGKRNKKKFITRREGDGVRCWRKA
jgi:hypothetical protein